MSGPRFGLTGLAVMGANLARNVAHHDIPIAVHNRTASKTEQFMAEHGSEGPITGTGTTEEFVQALERPRTIMTMVKAGPAVDAVIEELAPLLDEGDTIVDGGNSHFRDTQRRDKAMNERGLRFLGVGVSGGEEGALKGPSIMPGGSRESYDDVEHVFTSIAAQVDGTPCCTYVGADGAGHYVKMVHNGIEYADIQLIAEAYDLLRHGVGLEVPEIAQVFHEWNEGDLDSFLIEITAQVLDKTDERTGAAARRRDPRPGRAEGHRPLDRAGRARARRAADRDHRGGVRALAVGARRPAQRPPPQQLAGPKPGEGARADRELVDDVRKALYASKVVAYAQGFEQMTAAAKSEGWELDLGAMATIWRGGCIIRARFLDRIREAYDTDPETPNLLLVDYFRDAVADAQDSWRRVISHSVDIGLPVPAFTSSLAYYDGYRRERGPASLIQGLRDLFGAHTYRRVDAEGTYHVRWGQDGDEVRSDA